MIAIAMVMHYFHLVLEHDLPPSLNLNHNTCSIFPRIHVRCESMAHRNILLLPKLSEWTLQVQYEDYSKSQLKKELKQHKHNNTNTTDVATIRFVAKLLRSKVSSENTNCLKNKMNSIDHDKEIKKNFWGHVKKFIKKPNKILPNFNREICTNYFSKILRITRPLRGYVIPEWIPRFSRPTIDFCREPPSYQEIAKIIRKMKASGSPCPLDQVSVICLKRCPYLRIYLTALVVEIWKSGHIPVTWKKDVSTHKKRDSDKQENFHPITLEPVLLKVFTSLLRDLIHRLLHENNYIECQIQKGFIQRLSGILQHTYNFSYLIDQARIKQ